LLSAYPLLFTGGISGLFLSATYDEPTTKTVVAGVAVAMLTAGVAIAIWGRAQIRKNANRSGVVRYRNNTSCPHDPPSRRHRWITAEEAAALLNAGQIGTFGYGQPDAFDTRMLFGEPTGIKLIDFGSVRHIYVEPAMELAMIPIARAAQKRHGRPQFTINGKYERI
jgi:hypothetical protein